MNRVAGLLHKHLVRLIVGALLLLAVLGHAAKVWQLPFVSALDAYFYDIRVRLSASGSVDDRLVVVDIDEKSLAELGRWPWGRNLLADMVGKLADDYRVAVIGFDVVFAEPDDSSGLGTLEAIGQGPLKSVGAYHKALDELRPALDYDQVFAQALRGRPVVLGYYFSDVDNAQRTGVLPTPVMNRDALSGVQFSSLPQQGYGANLAILQAAARSAGHFNPVVDFDGVARRVPMLLEYQGHYYEALSLAVFRALQGENQLKVDVPPGSPVPENLLVISSRGVTPVPVDDALAALVPYRGRERSFPYVSAVDVIKGRIPREQLANKVVLVGTTAPGLMDLRSTPVGAVYPGVEVHANLVAGMMSGTIKAKPLYVWVVDALQLLVLGGGLVLLLPLLSPLRATLATGGALLVHGGLVYATWQQGNLVIPMAATILLILAIFAFNMSWGYFVESRSKRQFTELFGQYVPPELVDEMARDPESYSMAGRNETLTVMFSDVRSFTTLSEGMSPQELTQLMNEYLGAMTDVIRAQRGTLDKYIGDAIMAFWGAPVADPEHARHAVLTALSMQKALRTLDAPFAARGWPQLHIGVGINTGPMTVGDMGSPVRKAYTVMGDAVNLASRLEGITKEYGVGIVVGEVTRESVKDVVFRELDRVRVKGKEAPVAIYEPLGLADALEPDVLDELKLWQHALRLYRNQDWDQSELQLYNLRQRNPACRLYALYSERVAALRVDPPPMPWDGVTTFKTK